MAAALGSSSMVLFSICPHTASRGTQKVTYETPAVLVEETGFFPITSFRAFCPKVVTVGRTCCVYMS